MIRIKLCPTLSLLYNPHFDHSPEAGVQILFFSIRKELKYNIEIG